MITSDIIEGLTFDDVLLLPARSEVLPSETDTSTQFTRGLRCSTGNFFSDGDREHHRLSVAQERNAACQRQQHLRRDLANLDDQRDERRRVGPILTRSATSARG